jgi:hypothetical protein
MRNVGSVDRPETPHFSFVTVTALAASLSRPAMAEEQRAILHCTGMGDLDRTATRRAHANIWPSIGSWHLLN